MQRYPDEMPLDLALRRFFADARLGPDGGYGERWVRVETKPVPVYFPNTRCRVEAAKLHDLHHVATGYATDWPGEAEIAAWELAGGCGRHGWAWLLDLGAFTVGLALAPRRVWRAFVRGRRAANLYHSGLAPDALPLTSVGALRSALRVSRLEPERAPGDAAAFALLATAGVIWHVGIAAAGLAAAWHLTHWLGLVR